MDYYRYYSRKILFEDTKGDLKAEASKLRKITCLNYFSSLAIHRENRFTCELLKRDLEAYSKIVDNPNGVNNYVADVLEALPNNVSGNQKQWKSSITVDQVAELLKPLECASLNEGWEKFNCPNVKPTDKEVKTLQKSRIHQDTQQELYGEKRKINETVPESPGQKRKLVESVHNKPFGHTRTIVENVPQQSKPSTSNFQPKLNFSRKTIDKPVEKPKDQMPTKPNCFKTAGEELRIQNVKKFGKDNGNGRDNQLNYGLSKKSLGSRRGGGINGKFQPPILRNEGDETEEKQSNSKQSDDVVDERLKNIDPKMIEIIQNEIMDSGPKLTWDDIAGLEFAKNTIQEIVVWPMLRPDIFTGLRRPPRGILLFGPPGTGKTLIGKCIASQSGATFLSISASSLTSKWVGDGEKMVRALFAVARVNQPSVVFIDEIDSLLSQRSDTEHESSRRIKTEFLVQLDGVGTGDEDRILIIGATNRPQELDEAARRRLVKRLYIPLPEANARAEIVRNLISKERHTLTENNISRIADLTEGYSGADMKHVCQESALGPIRSIPPMQIRDIDTSQVRPVNISDFESALNRVKSTVSPDDLHSYLAWDKQFGCGSI